MSYLVTKRNNPWHSFGELDRDSFFRDLFSSHSESWAPAYEVEEEENHYLISLEIPGIPKDEIKIEAADNVLTISGEKHSEKKLGSNWYGERRYGKFQRSFTLPPGVDNEKIEARYEHGLLHLLIPKMESAKPRQIKISTESNGLFGKLLGDSRKREEAKSPEEKGRVA